ncbi:MAG TPA: hypothetical protein EYG03_12555 [Planctomycetes bacterium]|nr:hypothetical protein [Fuerstiella sp.]HIK92794.1 hypothetical protein [Planctomycetota bacterium]
MSDSDSSTPASQTAIAMCFAASIGAAAFSSFAGRIAELVVILGFAGFFIFGALLIKEVVGSLEPTALLNHLFSKSPPDE